MAVRVLPDLRPFSGLLFRRFVLPGAAGRVWPGLRVCCRCRPVLHCFRLPGVRRGGNSVRRRGGCWVLDSG
ncbi:hypothetical protein Abiwalacus_05010 [Akkermansia biwaensis]|uniref:Uncharacterized protein n=1 Tax=Akkermansia biwaensis TaxID=2946555 RepID=A0ABN6QGS3_9BACT|nr:hypothetical protein Abiwalacus_05010 [Akkermansia biwaensis]